MRFTLASSTYWLQVPTGVESTKIGLPVYDKVRLERLFTVHVFFLLHYMGMSPPKVKLSSKVAAAAKLYENETFVSEGSKLICRSCIQEIGVRKTQIDQHLKTEKHRSNMGRKLKQKLISETCTPQSFCTDLCQVRDKFLQCLLSRSCSLKYSINNIHRPLLLLIFRFINSQIQLFEHF